MVTRWRQGRAYCEACDRLHGYMAEASVCVVACPRCGAEVTIQARSFRLHQIIYNAIKRLMRIDAVTQQPITALEEVRRMMDREAWREAILLAAKFADLGAQRDAILSAREAYLRPDFQRQLRRDPAALIAAGIEAMRVRYGR